jgi:hypothetical protein
MAASLVTCVRCLPGRILLFLRCRSIGAATARRRTSGRSCFGRAMVRCGQDATQQSSPSSPAGVNTSESLTTPTHFRTSLRSRKVAHNLYKYDPRHKLHGGCWNLELGVATPFRYLISTARGGPDQQHHLKWHQKGLAASLDGAKSSWASAPCW